MYLEGECTCGGPRLPGGVCPRLPGGEGDVCPRGELSTRGGGGVCLGVSAWECVSQRALWKTPPNCEQNDGNKQIVFTGLVLKS